jgi:predicted permease
LTFNVSYTYNVVIVAVVRDLRFAGRTLAARPLLVAVAVVSVAIGAGLNLSVYSVLRRVLFESMVTADRPERLVRIPSGISFLNYEDLRHSGLPIDLAAMQMSNLTCGSCGDSRTVSGHVVSGNFFDVASARPVLGRTFTEGESDQVVVTYAFWQRLGADPNLVGRTIHLNGWPFQIVGVLPKGFAATAIATGSVYVPINERVAVALKNRRAAQFDLFGRLHDGTTRQQAAATLKIAAIQLETRFPDDNPGLARTITVSSMDPFGFLSQFPAGRLVLGASAALYGLVALLLVVACANVAALLVFRIDERRYELAVRAALGASRAQLARQLVAESFIISSLGCAAAATLWWLSLWWLNTRILPGASTELAVLPSSLPLGYCGLLVGITTVACGVIPAWSVGRTAVLPGLQLRRTGAVLGSLRVQRWLVAVEVAICCVVLSAGALLARNFIRLQAASPGFDMPHLVEIDIRVPSAAKPVSVEVLQDAARAVPGVQAVTWGSPIGPPFTEALQVIDSTGVTNVRADVRRVGPQFFTTIDVGLVVGRDFTVDDLDNRTVLPIIVNESFVRRHLGSRMEAALGHEFLRGGDRETGRAPQRLQVVGVSRDCFVRTIGDGYVPVAFLPVRQPSLTVRTASAPAAVSRSLQQAVERVEPGGTVVTVTPMGNRIAVALLPLRIATLTLGALSVIACVLGMSGLFAVVTRAAQRRTFEMAVRLAVGASRQSIVGLVLKEAMRTAGPGIAIGVVCVLALARVVQAVITAHSLVDPSAISVAVMALFAISACASLGPALRVSRIDPLMALRTE